LASKKISDLTADAAPTGDDLIATVNDPGVTPDNRKLTIASFNAALDHGSLAGLADDDHPHYLLADGSRAADELTITAPLAVASGGTGAATLTDHGVLLGSGTAAISATAVGTAGQILTSNGAGFDPTFEDAPAPGGDASAAWPVGSVFISVLDTNPSTLLGFGTWEAFAAGRVLVGIDPLQAEFDTLLETGGAKTHTLTSNEMPAHTHTQSVNSATNGGLSGYTPDASTNTSTTSGYSTGSTGGGAAHNNLQPFVVVSMWRRTA